MLSGGLGGFFLQLESGVVLQVLQALAVSLVYHELDGVVDCRAGALRGDEHGTNLAELARVVVVVLQRVERRLYKLHICDVIRGSGCFKIVKDELEERV